jgi:hypothetical protein
MHVFLTGGLGIVGKWEMMDIVAVDIRDDCGSCLYVTLNITHLVRSHSELALHLATDRR